VQNHIASSTANWEQELAPCSRMRLVDSLP